MSPAISMFYGLVIYMYFHDVDQHHTPHIHVKYQGEEVVLSLPNGLAINGESLFKIDPLK